MSGKNDNAGMVQEVELPSSYKQQNIEETEKARQKLKETSKTQEQAQDDVVPRFGKSKDTSPWSMSALTRILAKEKTVDQLSVKATDDIAFQRFKRKMPNNGWSGQCNILILARVATFAAVARGTSEVTDARSSLILLPSLQSCNKYKCKYVRIIV